jgi:hypothetical protein
MYQYINDILSIPAKLLYEDLALMSYKTYNVNCFRGKIKRTQKGLGKGNEALISFEDLPHNIKEVIIEALGPPQKAPKYIFETYITKDVEALKYYHNYTTCTGEQLPEKNIKEYTCNAEIFNACKTVLSSGQAKRKALGSKVNAWPKIVEIIKNLPLHKYPHSLPTSERRMRERYNLYHQEGYESLIHNNFGQKNAERLSDDAKSWVLARWCDQVRKCTNYNQLLREYNTLSTDKGWKTLKSEQTLINYLTHSNVEPLWFARRFGELRAKEKFNYQHTTKLPSMRDSLWYSDGTKLNYYYQDEDGKMKTVQVYEVFDTFSEVFIGYHISDTENFEAQYLAFKMAMQIAEHKPWEIKFDNQGGTKKLEATSFLGKLARLTTRTAPYNGKSKTIENAFWRFQSQILKQDWFFTGQNIQAKSLESKANMEMILANKKSLPTLDEVKKIYAQRRKEWNEAPHPKTGKPRLEMYLNSYNPETPKLELWDMIDMFWITREKEITCTAYGIMMKHQSQEYNYMLFDENRMPDVEWLRRNINKKFVIKYDPDDLTIVQLCENTPLGLRKVGMAEIKTEIHRNKQEQEAGEASFIQYIDSKNKELRMNDWEFSGQNLQKHGMSNADYGLLDPALKGIKSKDKIQSIKKSSEPTDIGEYLKEESNLEEIQLYDIV